MLALTNNSVDEVGVAAFGDCDTTATSKRPNISLTVTEANNGYVVSVHDYELQTYVFINAEHVGDFITAILKDKAAVPSP